MSSISSYPTQLETETVGNSPSPLNTAVSKVPGLVTHEPNQKSQTDLVIIYHPDIRSVESVLTILTIACSIPLHPNDEFDRRLQIVSAYYNYLPTL